MEYLDAVAARHSEYALGSDIDVSQDKVMETIRAVAEKVPSSYNSQSARAFVLFGEDHLALWEIVRETLRAKVGDPERFARTNAKIDGFAAATGTILFYEIDSVTQGLIEKYPSYAGTFPTWAEHGNAILQFAVWTALRDIGLGANLQHYNPLIDDRVRETFGIPDGYRLVAQMPFGRMVNPSPGKEKLPGTETVRLAHVVSRYS